MGAGAAGFSSWRWRAPTATEESFVTAFGVFAWFGFTVVMLEAWRVRRRRLAARKATVRRLGVRANAIGTGTESAWLLLPPPDTFVWDSLPAFLDSLICSVVVIFCYACQEITIEQRVADELHRFWSCLKRAFSCCFLL